MVKVVGIIQARISSSRLPAKAMLNIEGKTLLERVIERVQLSTKLDEIYIATSKNKEDDLIEDIAKKYHIKCYRGSLNNVFDRFAQVISISNADIVVRITADNPLTEPKMIDYGVSYLRKNKLDYLSFKNIPVGSGVEVFTSESFKKIQNQDNLNSHNIEHVTSYYYQNPHLFSIKYIEDFYNKNLSTLSVTVDTLEDYIKIYNIFKKFDVDISELLDSYIEYELNK